jgi:hypothetical protein
MPQPSLNRRDHYVPQGYLRGFIDPARKHLDRPLWCLSKPRNRWERKSARQICQVKGMYEFADDAITAEHADVTFKRMEDDFPAVRDALVTQNFVGWKGHLDFLLTYLQMIRVRSPQFFVEQGRAITTGYIGRITSIDETRTKITYDPTPLTAAQVHDQSLFRMRVEFKKGSDWMSKFSWQIRTTFDPHNPVVTSEAPLFAKGSKLQAEAAMTMELLKDDESELWFPLCWQAAIVGRARPFGADLIPFEQPTLSELRHIVAEMAPLFVVSPHDLKGLVLDGRPRPGRN